VTKKIEVVKKDQNSDGRKVNNGKGGMTPKGRGGDDMRENATEKEQKAETGPVGGEGKGKKQAKKKK